MEDSSVSERKPLLKKHAVGGSYTDIPSRHLHNVVTSCRANGLPQDPHRYHDQEHQQQQKKHQNHHHHHHDQQQQQQQQHQSPVASEQETTHSKTHQHANISNPTASLRKVHHHSEHQEPIHHHYDSQQEEGASSATPQEKAQRYVMSSEESKKCMAMITLVSFLVSCAGKLHSPVLVQYVYQMYTDSVYGNDSAGVHISKHPCVNDSADNTSADPRNQEVQDKSADLFMRLDMVAGAIGLFVNVFLGSYSDSLGRRFLLLVPMIGHFLRNATAPVIIYLDLGLPALYVGYVMDGICGGSPGILLGLYVYMADITRSDQQRTLGMAIVETVLGLTNALTNLAAGYFIEGTGFFYPSLVSSILVLLAALVVFFMLPETIPRDRKRCYSPVEGIRRVLGIFGPQQETRHQALLLLSLFAFFVGAFPDYADTKLRSLYAMDYPFCWSSIEIGIFSCAKDGSSRIASLVLIQLLRACVLTPFLAMMGVVSFLGGDILMALARTDIMVYMVSVVSMAGSMLSPSLRAMMSRMVHPDKQGALFAAIAVVESVCHCLSQFTILSLYRATASIFNGLVYFVIGGFHLLVLLCLIIYVYLLRRVVPSRVQPISVQTDEPSSS